jgi:branched-chain amino acid transport system ATP-binding protein
VLDKAADALLKDDDVREFYLGLHPGEDAEEHRRRSFRDVKHYRRKKRWSA